MRADHVFNNSCGGCSSWEPQRPTRAVNDKRLTDKGAAQRFAQFAQFAQFASPLVPITRQSICTLRRHVRLCGGRSNLIVRTNTTLYIDCRGNRLSLGAPKATSIIEAGATLSLHRCILTPFERSEDAVTRAPEPGATNRFFGSTSQGRVELRDSVVLHFAAVCLHARLSMRACHCYRATVQSLAAAVGNRSAIDSIFLMNDEKSQS